MKDACKAMTAFVGLAVMMLTFTAYAAVNPDFQWHDGYYFEQDENTILLLHLDEGTGMVTDNAVEWAPPGTLIAPAQWIDGMFGKAGSFSGANYEAITLNWFVEQQAQEFTVEMWIYPTAPVTVDHWQSLMNIPNHLDLRWTPSENRIYVSFDANPSTGYGIYWDGVPDHQWSHIAATWDNTEKEFRLYVNGVLRANEQFPGVEPWGYSAKKIVIGNHEYVAAGYGFEGLIDEIRVSNAVRNFVAIDSEIVAATSIDAIGPGSKITWMSEAGADYDIEYQDAGGSWTSMNLTIAGTGELVTYVDAGNAAGGVQAPAMDGSRQYRIIKK